MSPTPPATPYTGKFEDAKYRNLTARIPLGTYQAFARLAAENDRSISGELRLAIRLHLGLDPETGHRSAA